MTPANYHLGLPAWAFPGWTGRYFNSTPSTLASYASVFNTVEGNTTFYHIPDVATVDNWRQSVINEPFKFCFKLPRTVTHQATPNLHDLDLFLNRIEPLGKHLGPFLLQFPATVGPAQLPLLHSLIARLPQHYRYTLEVRHDDFFNQPQLLEPLIERYQLGRVIMDTRPVFRGNRHHPEVTAALHDKPDLPVLSQVYNGLVFVRLLLHPDLTSNNAYLDQWTGRIAQALNAGCECHMMIHCPNNQHCPALALDFHRRLQQRTLSEPLAPLPGWPVPQQHDLL